MSRKEEEGILDDGGVGRGISGDRQDTWFGGSTQSAKGNLE